MREIMRKAGIENYGVCAFEHLPLLPVRSAARLPENARSVLVCLFPYYAPEAARGNVSIYCAVEDYHGIVLEMLNAAAGALRVQHPGEEFAVFTDASPIPEVRAAALAGLGVIGENGLLITQGYGSYVFIGEIVTTLALPAEKAELRSCVRCGRCVSACPGGAIDGGKIDSAKCASAISQKKGALTEREREILRKSGKAFGCDICQSVCPMNMAAARGMPVFHKEIIANISKENLPQSYKNRAFGWRGLAVLQRNLEILQEAGGE